LPGEEKAGSRKKTWLTASGYNRREEAQKIENERVKTTGGRAHKTIQ
jgi:hypothetical protein